MELDLRNTDDGAFWHPVDRESPVMTLHEGDEFLLYDYDESGKVVTRRAVITKFKSSSFETSSGFSVEIPSAIVLQLEWIN